MNSNLIRQTNFALLALGAHLVAKATPPFASEMHRFDIPAESAKSAVKDLALQAEIDIMGDAQALEGMRTRAIQGTLSLDAALQRLVKGTGLTYSYVRSGAVLLYRAQARSSTSPPASLHRASDVPAVASSVAAAAPAQEPVELEQIVVTAQRRPENLQDVPISAQVFEPQILLAENVSSLYSLSDISPSIHVGENSKSGNIYIRGIGSGESSTFPQSVATFVDEMYFGRARTSGEPLFDLERIEVLKGPQSTFSGNNAIAGALNIVTAKPDGTSHASLRALYGQYGQYAAEGMISEPITDSLSFRAAAIADGQQGWLHDLGIGRDVPGESNLAGRLTLRLAPVDSDMEVLLKIEGSKNRNVGALALQDVGCPPAAPFKASGFCLAALASAEPFGLGNNFIADSPGQQILLTLGEYELTVKDTIWGQVLTSVTGYYDYQFSENEDTDGTALTLLNVAAPEDYWQFSQELRIASPTSADRALDYMIGLYFDEGSLKFRHDTGYFFLTPQLQASAPLALLVPDLPLGQDINYSQPEKTYSAFGSVTWHITSQLAWSVGLRGSVVDKSYSWNLYYGTAAAPYSDVVPLPAPQAALAGGVANAAGLGTAGSLAGSRADTGVMPSSQIMYHFSADAMGYFSYAKGWKEGGFDGNDTTGVAANMPFAPEYVNAYELGFKSEWSQRRFLFNVALFRSDYTNLQVATNIASASGAFLSLVRNAASSRTQGAEIELDWVPLGGWRFSANVTIDEARYLRYPDVAPTQLQQALGIQTQDLSGHPTEFAPRWSGTLQGSYTLFLGQYALTSAVTGIASSSYFLSGNDDPLEEQGTYVRMDARITLEGADGHWALDLIGQNLTNQDILTFGINWPTAPGGAWLQKEEPRSLALQARFKW